ncbi:MAG TPA: nucleotide exchange factor GrpE, partial [Clostridiales bacterium]|nr:nucleotide exchange factor GrpE [Clostridiales bacterium]
MTRKKDSNETLKADLNIQDSESDAKGTGSQEEKTDGSVSPEAVDADTVKNSSGIPVNQDPAPDPTAELMKQLDEMKERLYRTAAEYENFRKRTAKERESIGLNAAADTVAAFLPILDNITRARDVAKDADKAVKEGLALVLKQFDEILDKLGVSPIPAVGESFDPQKHNAVMHITDDKLEENRVVEEYQKGYQLGDRVI